MNIESNVCELREEQGLSNIQNKLQFIREKNRKNVIFSYLNVNSIRNKFEDLKVMVTPFIDIFCVAETKIDSSFQTSQFELDGFHKPFRLDVSASSGGILTYIKSNLPSRELTDFTFPETIQAMCIEINLRKEKWLLVPIYRPPSQPIEFFLKHLSKSIDHHASNYSNILILGDFNDTAESREISKFLDMQSLSTLCSSPTCFKSKLGRCIDLVLTNKKGCFKLSSTFETGVSDFHHLIFTVLKTKISCLPPKRVDFRSYKHFSIDNFRNNLHYAQSCSHSGDISSFLNVFNEVLNNHAPLKTKIIRGNHQPHVSQTLCKAIMTRSRLKRIANKTNKPEDILAYKKQRNLVVNLNKREKKRFFEKAGSPSSNSGKSFWKACKPLFSTKFSGQDDKISLMENGFIISDELTVSNLFNDFFVNISKTISLPDNDNLTNTDFESMLKNFENHPSVEKIKNLNFSGTFDLEHVYPWEVRKAALSLNPKKATGGFIPTRILQECLDECIIPLTDGINASLLEASFPSELSLAEVIPVYKAKDRLSKTNYRPISLLPVVSKVYEKILSSRISKFMENRLSKLLCGFRSRHSTQHALFRLLCKWQDCLDKKGVIGTILMDLSKAFDTLPHGLLLAKLKAYGFSTHSLKFFHSYLSGRFQKVKVGSTFSKLLKLALGVPQGSILGPLLFNIFINELFLFIENTDVCNFADDNTLYSCGHSLDEVIATLKHDIDVVLKWFESNHLAANPSKFQLMFLGVPSSELPEFIVQGITLQPLNEVKLLGVTIDHKLKFDSHIRNICAAANRKINCLYRIRRFLNIKQLRAISNAYIVSTFLYAPLIWMFCHKGAADLIIKTHKRLLKAIYPGFSSDESYSYKELLKINETKSIHTLHLQSLLTEIYKRLNNISPELMNEFFRPKHSKYGLRDSNLLQLPPAYTLSYGTNSTHFKGCLIWNSLPQSLKNSSTLQSFKSGLRSFDLKCNCRICK